MYLPSIASAIILASTNSEGTTVCNNTSVILSPTGTSPFLNASSTSAGVSFADQRGWTGTRPSPTSFNGNSEATITTSVSKRAPVPNNGGGGIGAHLNDLDTQVAQANGRMVAETIRSLRKLNSSAAENIIQAAHTAFHATKDRQERYADLYLQVSKLSQPFANTPGWTEADQIKASTYIHPFLATYDNPPSPDWGMLREAIEEISTSFAPNNTQGANGGSAGQQEGTSAASRPSQRWSVAAGLTAAAWAYNCV